MWKDCFPFIEIQVSNFSKETITIDRGQPIGRLKTPEEYLDQQNDINEEERKIYESQANAIKTIAQDMKIRSAHDDFPHIPGDEPVEGGPKAAEVPPSETKRS